MTADEFYMQRDQRTAYYLREQTIIRRPILVRWGMQAAHSTAGQTLLLALVNQLARFCRSADFIGPDAGLRVVAPFGGTSLRDSLRTMSQRIDPYGYWGQGDPREASYTISVGPDGGTAEAYLGCDGWLAYACPTPESVPPIDPNGTLGAGLASCLGAANAFKASLGLPNKPFSGRLSLWSYTRDAAAAQGPELPNLDLGRVLVIGAGAVASALVYWLLHLPVQASWDIVDKDVVQLDNTNRGLLFTPKDAGWPVGRPREKAEVLARFLTGARHHPVWFDEFRADGHRWDIVLPLANERGVRRLVQASHPPLMIHATTSSNWYTQLHRHRPDQDRCLACRFPDTSAAPPACAVVPLNMASEEHGPDAALPFLSAAAGLLLAADLVRLGLGNYKTTHGNLITLDWFGSIPRPTVRQEHCDTGCQHWGEPTVRRMLNASSRWYTVDSDALTS